LSAKSDCGWHAALISSTPTFGHTVSPPKTSFRLNLDGAAPAEARAPPVSAAYVRPRHSPWAELLRRTFEIDILACPDCGNRLRLVATIENRDVIERILAHLGLPVDVPTPAPARSTEWLPGVLSGPEGGAGSKWFD